MTEQDFQRQVWRMYDQITTAEGVKGKVLGVSFSTKSVRAYISGAPEWVHCDLIETHTTGKGGDADDTAIIEELHNKIMSLNNQVETLKSEKLLLTEKMSKNHAGALLTQVNIIGSQLQEKKKRIEKIETSMQLIREIVEKIAVDNV